MNSGDNFRNYAADCIRQAESQSTPEDKNILLNMALAWVRLAQQAQELSRLDIEVAVLSPYDTTADADSADGEVYGPDADNTHLVKIN